ncbi:PAS/PAC sensor signal transduction histidine kinase [[Leptolyngbya] sp. PCC 7376]|uniref:sensor histidine kinase n=1 Tax=[Leptolyngbya] sp. PCC 7376 TaxID=111781 RepID=UPI00029F2471|nr:ATP-binding protein [[Leptolyngbya] sp. PCC 7376]AFY36710.1 PAS/PAC sensor signal transduction histidine kinase [[Leptolyngbya] sp. PCC 7376]
MEDQQIQNLPSDEAMARLEQELSQARAKIAALEQARTEEKNKREQIEFELKNSQQMLQLVMDTLPETIFWKDLDSVYLGYNQNFANDAGLTIPGEALGKTDFDMPWTTEEAEFYRACDRRVMLSDQPEFGIIEPQLNSKGEHTWVETNKAPLRNVNGEIIGILGTYHDITERKQAELSLQKLNQQLEKQTTELAATLEQLQQSQLQLIQREKMSALGNLIAGVAHEINNPVGFISGNLEPAQEYVQDLFELLDLYQNALPEPSEEIIEKIETIDLEYIQADFPKVLNSMGEGIKRIANISKGLRTFSRADTENRILFQLHEGLDSTILILQHRLKANEERPAIEVVRDYGKEVPALNCFPGQMNQVFMNLLANAIDALEESNEGKGFAELESQPNRLTVSTRFSSAQDSVTIKIQDNGIGIPKDIQNQIFNNSFTTKDVGKGTGLGLAIARQIIVDKHGGTLTFNSSSEQGTEFVIKVNVA